MANKNGGCSCKCSATKDKVDKPESECQNDVNKKCSTNPEKTGNRKSLLKKSSVGRKSEHCNDDVTTGSDVIDLIGDDMYETNEKQDYLETTLTSQSVDKLCRSFDNTNSKDMVSVDNKRKKSLNPQSEKTLDSKCDVQDVSGEQSLCYPCGEIEQSLCYPCGEILAKHYLHVQSGTYSRENLFPCSQCGQKRSNSYKIMLNVNVETPVADQAFKCYRCCTRFSAGSVTTVLQCIGTTLFTCSHCDNRVSDTFNVPLDLPESGPFNVVKQFACPQCSSSFSLKRDLERHIRIHTGEKPFCRQEFGKRGKRVSVSFNVALDDDLPKSGAFNVGKPFACRHCRSRFGRKGHLESHIRIHTGEKPFRCQQCGKRFTRDNGLKNHIRLHTGEKPFECPHCVKRYSSKSHLAYHLQSHRVQKPKKP